MKINFKQGVVCGGYQIVDNHLVTRYPPSLDLQCQYGWPSNDGKTIFSYSICGMDENGHACFKGQLVYRTVDFNQGNTITCAFSQFSRIKEPDEIIVFANQYGPLGYIDLCKDGAISGYTHATLNRARGIRFLNEPVDFWLEEARMFRRLLRAKKATCIKELQEIFRKQRGSRWINHNMKRDLNEAKSQIWVKLNFHFNQYLTPVFDDNRGVSLNADNLYAALWAEMACYYAGETDYIECRCGCGEWFKVGDNGKRRQSRFVDIAHRNHYNNRKRPTTRSGRNSKEDQVR